MGISRADGLAAPPSRPRCGTVPPCPSREYYSPARIDFFGSPAIAYLHAEATLIIGTSPRSSEDTSLCYVRQAPASPTGVHPWRALLPGVSAHPAKVPNDLPGYDEAAGEVLPSLFELSAK